MSPNFRNDTFVSPINRERKAVWREIGKRVAINKAIVSTSKRHWNLIIENLAERQKNIQRYSRADLLGSQKYPGWIYPVNNNPAFILSLRLAGFEIKLSSFSIFQIHLSNQVWKMLGKETNWISIKLNDLKIAQFYNPDIGNQHIGNNFMSFSIFSLWKCCSNKF